VEETKSPPTRVNLHEKSVFTVEQYATKVRVGVTSNPIS
jgi:hypothetical protein